MRIDRLGTVGLGRGVGPKQAWVEAKDGPHTVAICGGARGKQSGIVEHPLHDS